MSRRATCSNLFAIAVTLGACVEVARYEPRPAVVDARVDALVADVDSAIDDATVVVDGNLGDDASGFDLALDSVQPLDASPPDAAPPDTASADLPLLPAPCVAPSTKLAWEWNMAICKLPAGTTTNQCNAADLCNAADGWQLCTASEYLANGGKTAPTPDGNWYWLAACMREGDTVFPPTDTICAGACQSSQMAQRTIQWSCTGSSYMTSPWTPAGVEAGPWCRRLGQDALATQAYWHNATASQKLEGSVCCH